MKTTYKISTILLSLLLMISLQSFAFVKDDYQTKGSGNWSDYHNVWQRYTGSIWEDALKAPDFSNSNSITILSGYTITDDLPSLQVKAFWVYGVLDIPTGNTLSLNSGGFA